MAASSWRSAIALERAEARAGARTAPHPLFGNQKIS
jgi:hypothetical protein